MHIHFCYCLRGFQSILCVQNWNMTLTCGGACNPSTCMKTSKNLRYKAFPSQWLQILESELQQVWSITWPPVCFCTLIPSFIFKGKCHPCLCYVVEELSLCVYGLWVLFQVALCSPQQLCTGFSLTPRHWTQGRSQTKQITCILLHRMQECAVINSV